MNELSLLEIGIIGLLIVLEFSVCKLPQVAGKAARAFRRSKTEQHLTVKQVR